MNTHFQPVRDVDQITLNDSDLASPTLNLLLWAIQPGVAKSAEFEEVLDRLCVQLPEYRVFRDKLIKGRAA